MQAARAALLESAQQYYHELVQVTPHDADSQRELADAHFMLSKVQMALGQDAEARGSLAAGLQLQAALVAASPTDAGMLTALAKTHNQLARISQKSWQRITQLRSAESLTKDQAKAAQQLLTDWKDHSAEVIRLRKAVVKLQPKDIESRRLLASAIMNEGNAIGIRGLAEEDSAQQALARKTILEAQDIRHAALAESTTEVTVQRDLARGYFNMANNEMWAVDRIDLANFDLSPAEQELNNQKYQRHLSLCIADLTKAIEVYEKLPTLDQQFDLQQELAQCYRLRADASQLLTNDEHVATDNQ